MQTTPKTGWTPRPRVHAPCASTRTAQLRRPGRPGREGRHSTCARRGRCQPAQGVAAGKRKVSLLQASWFIANTYRILIVGPPALGANPRHQPTWLVFLKVDVNRPPNGETLKCFPFWKPNSSHILVLIVCECGSPPQYQHTSLESTPLSKQRDKPVCNLHPWAPH